MDEIVINDYSESPDLVPEERSNNKQKEEEVDQYLEYGNATKGHQTFSTFKCSSQIKECTDEYAKKYLGKNNDKPVQRTSAENCK